MLAGIQVLKEWGERSHCFNCVRAAHKVSPDWFFKKAKCFTRQCFLFETLHICLTQGVILSSTSSFFATIAQFVVTSWPSVYNFFFLGHWLLWTSQETQAFSVGSNGHVCRLLLVDFDPCCLFRLWLTVNFLGMCCYFPAIWLSNFV